MEACAITNGCGNEDSSIRWISKNEVIDAFIYSQLTRVANKLEHLQFLFRQLGWTNSVISEENEKNLTNKKYIIEGEETWDLNRISKQRIEF